MKTTVEVNSDKIRVLKDMAVKASIIDNSVEKNLTLTDQVEIDDFSVVLDLANRYFKKLDITDQHITENDILLNLFGETFEECSDDLDECEECEFLYDDIENNE
jgi:hypothetical protein